jgi:imidazolonepropionase-like amidohydrolase
MRGCRFYSILLIVAAGTMGCRDFQPTAQTGVLAFTHVTIIDATGSPAQPGMTVVIEKGRIASIGKDADIAVPQEAHVIDGTGKFLIPGLVDMHVHTSWDPYFIRPLMLANGVTGVRDMFSSDLPAIQRRRKEVEAGRLSGPRILAAGAIEDGPGGPWPGSTIVSNAPEARTAVDRIKAEGYDYVKVYSSLSREAYFAIAEEARKDGITYAGHVPGAVRAIEASSAGQKSIEHLDGISLACSTQENELRESHVGPPNSKELRAQLDSFSEEKAGALFSTFNEYGTWQVPTLVVMRNADLRGDPEYAKTLSNSPRLRYVPYALKMMWNLALQFGGKPVPSEELAVNKRYFLLRLHIVGEMQKAGVGILAGTDTPNPFVYPGFGLHDELGLLVLAGLTPMEALQAATRNPAQYFGNLDSTGTIEQGKIADLDLLNANPLDDINNVGALDAVVLGGRLITRSELDALLATAQNNRWRANPAALTLMGLILHMIRKLLLICLAAVLLICLGIYCLRRRWRLRKIAAIAQA